MDESGVADRCCQGCVIDRGGLEIARPSIFSQRWNDLNTPSETLACDDAVFFTPSLRRTKTARSA